MEVKELQGVIEEKFNSLNAQVKESAGKSEAEVKALKDQVEALQSELKAAQEQGVSKDLIEKMQGHLDALDIKMQGKGGVQTKSFEQELTEIKSDLVSVAKGISGKEIEMKADTLRSSIANNTQSYDLPDIGQLATRKLSTYDVFRKFTLSKGNDNGTVKYWDWDAATTVRAAAAIAEGAAFPESTAKFVEKTVKLEKVGDILPVSEEFFEDAEMFAAELSSFLDTNVAIKVDDQLINGTGVAPQIKGLVASIDAYTPVASGLTDANIYDLLVKVSESITTTGGAKYAPDFAFMHISTINKMKLKKDVNNNYIIPPFVSRDGKQVDTMIVVENNALTPNTMVVGDRRYARIYEKAGLQFSKGYTGDQFGEDMMSLKVRKRIAFLVRDADKSGFKKVTSISAALTTLAGAGV